ncbi:MAG: LPP20 family lipoprotein [Deltaproteobacteria bacterium]|nr:LPP20 family lipoprotein [Deltaproteobacteria bacterium]
MKKYSILSVVLAVLLILSACGFCDEWQELVENIGNGSINWTKGKIQARGVGASPEEYYGKPMARPMALRAARLDAIRNLLEVTQGVRIDSNTVVKDFAVTNDVIMAKISGMVKGTQIVKQEYLSDGTVEVTMQMSLYGGFAQLVLPQEIKQVESIKPVLSQTITPEASFLSVEPAKVSPAIPSKTVEKPTSEIFTGLIVNAKGLNARPAMSPKIIDENGQEVYGSAFVSREYAVQQGMSGYAKDMTVAQSNPRVTNNPLTVKGLKTEGPGKADIVISNADAFRLRSAFEHLSFMKKCRAIIVVD